MDQKLLFRYTISMPENTPSLLKQLLGASVGMLVALALYEGYGVVAPNVQGSLAYLFPPGTREGNPPPEGVRLSKQDAPEEMTIRAAARAQVVVERLTAPATEDKDDPTPPLTQAVQEVVDEQTYDHGTDDSKSLQGAPHLPSSGVTLWFALLLALVPSVIAVPRVRKWMVVRG